MFKLSSVSLVINGQPDHSYLIRWNWPEGQSDISTILRTWQYEAAGTLHRETCYVGKIYRRAGRPPESASAQPFACVLAGVTGALFVFDKPDLENWLCEHKLSIH